MDTTAFSELLSSIEIQSSLSQQEIADRNERLYDSSLSYDLLPIPFNRKPKSEYVQLMVTIKAIMILYGESYV